jgi:plasmid stability protein
MLRSACYHPRPCVIASLGMKSVITRMDDELHRALKVRARAQGRSVNALINELLAAAVSTDDRGRWFDARIAGLGLAVRVTPHVPPPSHDEVLASTRGAGSIASDAIEAGRSAR